MIRTAIRVEAFEAIARTQDRREGRAPISYGRGWSWVRSDGRDMSCCNDHVVRVMVGVMVGVSLGYIVTDPTRYELL